MLHIFIHFYIGHLEEDHGGDDYGKYKNLMLTEVILTFCLAGLIYLEGEFSTLLAIIIGNRLYKESFEKLTNKPISWHSNEYNVQLADKYNHVLPYPPRTMRRSTSPATPSTASTRT